MILLTAFKGNNNSSKILLDSISGDNIRKKLLTNSFDACEQEIVEAISIFQPEYVISFGRKPVINRLYIEPAACNECDCIRTNFDISVLEKSLSKHDLPYKVSSKLSNYLCNHAYYCGLRYIEKNTAETKMIFIHIPDMKNIQNMDSVISWLNDFCGGLNEFCFKMPYQ